MKKIFKALSYIFALATIFNIVPIAKNETEAVDTKAIYSVPEVIESQDGVRSNNYVRLKDEEKDLNTIVYADNGEIVIRSYKFPVKYVDKSGNIKDKSTTLSQKNVFSKYKYSVEQNDVQQYYPKNISDGVKLQHGTYSLVLKPNVTGNFSVKSNSDNSVEYDDVFGPRQLNGATSNHTGIDFNYSSGTALLAPCDAEIVEKAFDANNKGNYVVLKTNILDYDTGENLYIYYFHMKSTALGNVGDTVNAGTVVGYIGNTGYSFGAHLHMTVIKNKNIGVTLANCIDPQWLYIKYDLHWQ